MLAEKHSSKALAFIFMSDLDFHAIQIFLNLKFGTKNMSYASAIQCCPKLEWVGPSREDLENVRDRYARVLSEGAALDHPNWTNAQKEARRVQELNRMIDVDNRYFQQGHETRVTEQDRSMARGWVSSGMLDQCPLLKKAVEELLRTGRGVSRLIPSKLRLRSHSQKFRLSRLSTEDRTGVHDTLIRKIREACKETGSQHVHNAPNMQQDTQHRVFDALPSSLPAIPSSEALSSHPSSSQRVRTPREQQSATS
jgi:hypothetical protein